MLLEEQLSKSYEWRKQQKTVPHKTLFMGKRVIRKLPDVWALHGCIFLVRNKEKPYIDR